MFSKSILFAVALLGMSTLASAQFRGGGYRGYDRGGGFYHGGGGYYHGGGWDRGWHGHSGFDLSLGIGGIFGGSYYDNYCGPTYSYVAAPTYVAPPVYDYGYSYAGPTYYSSSYYAPTVVAAPTVVVPAPTVVYPRYYGPSGGFTAHYHYGR